MKQMTITCLPDGSVQHTLKDTLFRPFIDSDRKVERMSEIRFDEEQQAFYIHMLKELVRPPGAVYGSVFDKDLEYLNDYIFRGEYFDSYEGAVAYEIQIIEDLRLRGYSFETSTSNGHRVDEGVSLSDQSSSGTS